MSYLYLECNAGISGDMAVAAMIDAGADKDALQKALDSIPAHGFKTEISRVSKSGIDCCDFNVLLDNEHENHDHDMEYLFGHENAESAVIEPSHTEPHQNGEHNHKHFHEHEDHHHEENSHFDRLNDHGLHNDHEHHHHHKHRNLSDVLEIIDKTEMADGAKKLAHKIFRIIAEAESKAHNLPLEKVHFHEVGALDSIVDVIALSVCFESLVVNRVFVPFLNEGSGTVRCQHGILPVPVPAVANIAEQYKLPLSIIPDKGEFITPTGAAFVAAVITDKTLPETFTIKKIGLGAGKRNYSRPSILRAFLIEEDAKKAVTEQSQNHQKGNDYPNGHLDTSTWPSNRKFNDRDSSDRIVKLETNIDDCTGESLGFVMDELFSAGARDVHFIPCFMKKNRPAYLLSVICLENDRKKMEEIIFRHTTTIGIRRVFMERTVLDRKEIFLDSPYGKIRAKSVQGNGVARTLPEYDDVAEIARKSGKTFGEIFSELSDLCKGKI